eukprot:657937-Rhodomonas_salina.1
MDLRRSPAVPGPPADSEEPEDHDESRGRHALQLLPLPSRRSVFTGTAMMHAECRCVRPRPGPARLVVSRPKAELAGSRSRSGSGGPAANKLDDSDVPVNHCASRQSLPSPLAVHWHRDPPLRGSGWHGLRRIPVSYTHLTLPTICSV